MHYSELDAIKIVCPFFVSTINLIRFISFGEKAVKYKLNKLD